MRRLAVLGIVLVGMAGVAEANAINSACLKSNRAAGQTALCGCIQATANQLLTARDQKLAATFFEDPHKAQEIRQSKRRSHEAFWERYRNFTDAAEKICRS